MFMDAGLLSRRVALDILNDIFFRSKSMDEGFDRARDFVKLEPRDRAFVRLLVSTVLKRVKQMDEAIGKLLKDPLSELRPPQLVNIFRLGIAQFAFLETPAHAAVDTCVEMAGKQKGLVNAVMRRLTREGFTHIDARDAGRLNTPDWLWAQWMNDYGVETALDIAAANLDEAPVDFTVKNAPDAWAQKLEATLLPTGSLRKPSSGFIPDLAGYNDGEWWVQGASAALPAKVFSDLKSKTVIDLCAAPGGKTAQMAMAGAHVIALDRSADRMKRLEENMARLKLNVEIVIADGAHWKPKQKVDAVLLDAPCTATGTVRHQPDVLNAKTPKDQEKMIALQRFLMTNAFYMLKEGGEMVYCTCSLQKDEGERQTDWFLAQGLAVKLVSIEWPEISEILTPRGEIRCLPSYWKDKGGMDGFYVAKFVRN